MAGGIGGSGMASQNMGLSNLLPKMSMSPDARQMLAMALMQNQMRRQPDGPLGALAGMASMWAAGKTATDASTAREEKEAEAKAAEEARKQQRMQAAQSTLAQLGQTLYGGRNMEGYEGLIDPEDPYAGLRSALSLRAQQERPQGGGGSTVFPASGIRVQYDPETGEPFEAAFNPRTGQYQRIGGGGVPVNPQTGMPYQRDPTMVPPPASGPRRSWGEWAGQWRDSVFGGGQSGATGPAAPATIPATGGAAPAAAAVPAGPPPPGIPPEIWAEMTPEERAAFQ